MTFVFHVTSAFVAQVYSNTPETINLIIEVFVEVAHKQICYLGEVSDTPFKCTSNVIPADNNVFIMQVIICCLPEQLLPYTYISPICCSASCGMFCQ